ncbi:hypothetical protein [Cryptosporangium minutisporangium]|uniref:Uncharacterized protein n=1 Tax=Cryptosporangium minutisporangium TaxID=113569 RepID=A0ABP6SWD6_9ACTN
MTPTQLEQRLTDALTARADQVTAADLRPAAPPTGRRVPPRRGLYLGMALAAAISAIAVLVLLTQVREEPIRPSQAPSDQLTRLPATSSYDPSATPRSALPTVLGPTEAATPTTSDTPRPSSTDTPNPTVTPKLPDPAIPRGSAEAPQPIPTTAPPVEETTSAP